MKFNILGYTLSVDKTTKKKRKGFTAKIWTRSEVDTLLRFRNEGKPTSEIAELLHRTEPAIYSKLGKIRKGK